MPLYSCEICMFSSKLKADHKRHLITKKHLGKTKALIPMNQNEPKMNQNEPKMNQNEPKRTSQKKYYCEFCDESFNTLPSKRRHEIHRCKLNIIVYSGPINKSSIKIIESKHEKEKKILYKQIDNLIVKAGNTTNIMNNQKTQNIKLNGYGKEDLSHITDSMKTQMLEGPFGMIPKMIESVHFNHDKPENKNIQLTNSRDNKIRVFTGDKWVYKHKDEIISDLMDGKYFLLDTHYENICEDLNNVSQSRYETFRSIFDEKEPKVHDHLKKECELVLLNNR